MFVMFTILYRLLNVGKFHHVDLSKYGFYPVYLMSIDILEIAVSL